MKIAFFAHNLPPDYYQKMLAIAPGIPAKFPFIKIRTLVALKARLAQWPDDNTRQVISLATSAPKILPIRKTSARLCREANNELTAIVQANPDRFAAGVVVLPMNNIDAAIETIASIKDNPFLAGAQIFTRHLGRSIADERFWSVLAQATK